MYYLVYGLLYLVSLIPLRILYLLSDAVYGLLYYIIRYRREVVMSNLDIAFPNETIAWKIKTAKEFYQNFTDSFIESIKMISASDAYILKRLTGNWEVLNDLHKSGKSCYLLLGHYFNWEWGNLSVGLNIDYTLLVVYMPISNKILDRLFLKLRSRGKTKMLSAHHLRRDLMPFRNEQYALALVADQNPGGPDNAYWLNFFGRPTPFVTGPEKGARPRNLPLAFCYIEKVRRGYYHFVISVDEENIRGLKEGELTVKYVRHLENIIRKQPAMWLWSHNRWKHTWKNDYQKLWVDQAELMPQENTKEGIESH